VEYDDITPTATWIKAHTNGTYVDIANSPALYTNAKQIPVIELVINAPKEAKNVVTKGMRTKRRERWWMNGRKAG